MYDDGVIKYGFVTAGHCIDASYDYNDQEIHYNTVHVGKPIARRYQAGTVDAGFIETNENAYLSNLTVGGFPISGSLVDNIPKGSTVNMRGRGASVNRTGNVESNSYISAAYGGFLLKDQLKISYNVATVAGDSGGIVYISDPSATYRPIGIHCSITNDGYSIASKATNVYNVMGIYPY